MLNQVVTTKKHKVTQEEFYKIMEKHNAWLLGWSNGVCADLHNTDLRDINFQGMNLDYANLSFSDLSGVNLKVSSLRHARLDHANLNGANLSCATLTSADLSCAMLEKANLEQAILQHADLSNSQLHLAYLFKASLDFATLDFADLTEANLALAYLNNANLNNARIYGANLKDAHLENAELKSVDMDKANNIPFISTCEICPSSGSFIGWKKLSEGKIAKLFIPTNAKRSSATSRKCRCSYAKVLAIYDCKGKKCTYGCSLRNQFLYEVGKYVYPDSYDDNRWHECSHGIHFFITKKEAEEY